MNFHIFTQPDPLPTREFIVEVSRSFIGTPYKKREMDCFAFVLQVAKKIGYLPDSYNIREAYHLKPYQNFRELLSANFIQCGFMHLGDVALFEPHHAAIISNLGPHRIIHAWDTAGRVGEHDISSEFTMRYHSNWTWLGLD